ncbi:hypothetical protein Hanom_Chr13g01206631 [Helianthus anomalus]
MFIVRMSVSSHALLCQASAFVIVTYLSHETAPPQSVYFMFVFMSPRFLTAELTFGSNNGRHSTPKVDSRVLTGLGPGPVTVTPSPT